MKEDLISSFTDFFTTNDEDFEGKVLRLSSVSLKINNQGTKNLRYTTFLYKIFISYVI